MHSRLGRWHRTMDSTSNHFLSPLDSEEEAAAWSLATQLTTSSAIPLSLKAIIELGVLEIIAKAGPGATLSPTEIAAQLPANDSRVAATMLDYILRFLTCCSVLTCEAGGGGGAERRFGLSPFSRLLVKNKDGASLAPLLLLNHDKIGLDCWHYLKDAVLEGAMPFAKIHGISVFDYLSSDPRLSTLFNESMSNHTALVMEKMLDSYMGFQGLRELVDVGGGMGANFRRIVTKYPQIKGINFDLPSVIAEAPPIPGVEHVGGDMFVSIPNGEAIFMKWILHDWSDEQCVKILKNCLKALPGNGKVIVAECLLPEDPETSVEAQNVHAANLIMMTCVGGKERTEKEFQSLAIEAGFSGIKVVSRAYDVWIMEFLKYS